MEEDVIISDVSDSDIEIGTQLTLLNRKKRTKSPKVRPQKELYGFRKLRSKTFTQRHVYTTDLCQFLDLEPTENLERLSKKYTDEEIIEHLNQIYLKKKAHYDTKGVKRHKFMKPSFHIYVDDFKRYGLSGRSKTFYEHIQEQTEDHGLEELSTISENGLLRDPLISVERSRGNGVDHLIPVQKGKSSLRAALARRARLQSASSDKVAPPEPQQTLNPAAAIASSPIAYKEGPDDPIEQNSAAVTEGHTTSVPASPVSEKLDLTPISPIESAPLSPLLNSQVNTGKPLEELHESSIPAIARRSLRQRKFSQNHVYTVDLCAFLGLATRTELDSYSSSGVPDEEIFDKLNDLYEEKRKKNPGLKKDKFKFSTFQSHLEHHTKKYQKHLEATAPYQAETYSSQILEESSSEEDSLELTQNIYTSSREKRRLKGVLPYSYLKMQETIQTRPTISSKTRKYQSDRVGLAKRKQRKVQNNNDSTIFDFIDDDEISDTLETTLEADNDTPLAAAFEGPQAFEVSDLSDSFDDSEKETDLEMFGPFSASTSLFGAAEEDRSSGIDHMLSRAPRGEGTHKNGRSAPRKSRTTRHTHKRNIGTSTWSTNSKRIYRRNNRFSTKKVNQANQSRLNYSPVEVISDEEHMDEFPDITNQSSRVSATKHKSNTFSIPRPPSSSGGATTRENNQGAATRALKEKKKHQSHYYGVSPNLSVHSLSRAPQSYTPQLEAESHRYKVVRPKNYSKHALTPLEPPKIYRIPDEVPEDFEVPEFTPSLVVANPDWHDRRDLEVLKKLINLESENFEGDILSFTLEGVPFVLSKLNLQDSNKHVQKSFNLVRRALSRQKNGIKEDQDITVFLRKIAEWTIMTKDISAQYVINIAAELENLAEILHETVSENMSFMRQKSGSFALVLISLTALNMLICENILQQHGRSHGRTPMLITKFIELYLAYVVVCETPESFLSTVNGSDSAYYESMSLISMICENLPQVSFWSEVASSFQKHCRSNDIHRMIEYVQIFASFTDDEASCWSCVILMLRYAKKLIGFSQARAVKAIVDLVFQMESSNNWSIRDTIIVALYDTIGHAKFANFSGEEDDLKLKGEVSDTVHRPDDKIIDSYFKLLTKFIESESPPSTTLVEKIMPISALTKETKSDAVLINRINVLLIYSNIFRANFSKQLNVLLRHCINSTAHNNRLESAFDAICISVKISIKNGLRLPFELLGEVVNKVIDEFNSLLSIRLDSYSVQRSSHSLRKIISKLFDFLNTTEISPLNVIQVANEILRLKFHATPMLDSLLSSVLSLTGDCLARLKSITHDPLPNFIKDDFYANMTTLLGRQMSTFIPLQDENYPVISKLVDVWCDLSQYLVSHNAIDWNSVLFYHWNNTAGSSTREYFELQLLERLLESRHQVSSEDVFLKAFSRHVVKFNSERVFPFLMKLKQYYLDTDIIFTTSFDVESKQQFDSSRVQVVISYVYYLKKQSTEGHSDFKRSEALLHELLSSLEKEFEIQRRKVINFVWYCHFATKILKFINYSCLELVKNSVEFTKLRSKLNITYHSETDYAEKFKERLTNARNLEESIEVIEKEILSSIIQGEEADRKCTETLKSLVVDQFYNVYKNDGGLSSSPLYPFTVAIVSHLQIVSAKNSIVNWFMLDKYFHILLESILNKGSLAPDDLLCVIKMIQDSSIITNMEPNIATTFGTNYKNMVLMKLYKLIGIVYHLLSSYADQEKFLRTISSFIDSRQISNTEITQNSDYANCIRILNEEITLSHRVHDIITNIAKSKSVNAELNAVNLKIMIDEFIHSIKADTPLYLEF